MALPLEAPFATRAVPLLPGTDTVAAPVPADGPVPAPPATGPTTAAPVRGTVVRAPLAADGGVAAAPPATAAAPATPVATTDAAAPAPGVAAAPPFCWAWACSKRLAFCSSTLWTRFG